MSFRLLWCFSTTLRWIWANCGYGLKSLGSLTLFLLSGPRFHPFGDGPGAPPSPRQVLAGYFQLAPDGASVKARSKCSGNLEEGQDMSSLRNKKSPQAAGLKKEADSVPCDPSPAA